MNKEGYDIPPAEREKTELDEQIVRQIHDSAEKMTTLEYVNLVEQLHDPELAKILLGLRKRHGDVLSSIIVKYGTKILLINHFNNSAKYPQSTDRLETHLLTSPDENKIKLENETSYVYAAAKQIFEEISEREKIEGEYQLITRNENIINWANSTGMELFEWDGVDIKKMPNNKMYGEFTKYFGKKYEKRD